MKNFIYIISIIFIGVSCKSTKTISTIKEEEIIETIDIIQETIIVKSIDSSKVIINKDIIEESVVVIEYQETVDRDSSIISIPIKSTETKKVYTKTKEIVDLHKEEEIVKSITDIQQTITTELKEEVIEKKVKPKNKFLSRLYFWIIVIFATLFLINKYFPSIFVLIKNIFKRWSIQKK